MYFILLFIIKQEKMRYKLYQDGAGEHMYILESDNLDEIIDYINKQEDSITLFDVFDTQKGRYIYIK